MPKSSKAKVEADEIKILKELRKNSRKSLNEIAEKCGFSRQKVWRIIKDLEENKTIWGYSAVIDNEKLGLKQFFILIKRKGAIPADGHINIAINRIIKEKCREVGITIQGSFYTHGSFDWIVMVTGKNIYELTKFIESLRRDFHEVIADLQTIEVLFPLEQGEIENPNKTKLKEFF